MSLKSGKIHQGDCLQLMQKVDAGSVDLVFADPPFNIGYEYDQYDDRQDDEKYIAWCQKWIAEVHRVLKPSGTFWLAIGDEYAAELKVAAQRKIGFTTRSWVIWYYTFGVNCKYKFSRSHAHLFHFVKDEKEFTFNSDDPEIRVPSARALVYGDKRANPKGRLPDDTWILRPQDFQSDKYGFTPEQDTWFFSRVAGTFKERQGFHGCQMPEQLLGRIIRASSNEGDLVLDPFSGSGTTMAVAKKLGRDFLGCELSEDYVKYASDRLKSIKVGDPLDGPADPIASAPSTAAGVRLDSKGRRTRTKIISGALEDNQPSIGRKPLSSKGDIEEAVREAFHSTHEGFSVDRVVVDPHLNHSFVERCSRLGIPGEAADFNRLLMRLRKNRKLGTKFTSRNITISHEEFDCYSFAAEIAWGLVRSRYSGESLDEILCDPKKVQLFDSIARDFAPGFKPVEYRWAALHIRKKGSDLRKSLSMRFKFSRFSPARSLEDFETDSLRNEPGIYILRNSDKNDLYLGETNNLAHRLEYHKRAWSQVEPPEFVSLLPHQDRLEQRKTCLVARRHPQLNVDLKEVLS